MSWWEREGNLSGLGKTESEEYIVPPPGKAKMVPLEIWESKEFDVDRGSVGPGVPVSDGKPQPPKIFDGVGGTGAARVYETKTTVTTTVTPARRSESRSDSSSRD